MQHITGQEFLEQVELGATVLPQDSAQELGVQIGRWQYRCPTRALTRAQAARLEGLYRAGRLRFAHPGDFRVAPDCFWEARLRFRVVSASTLSSVPRWIAGVRRGGRMGGRGGMGKYGLATGPKHPTTNIEHPTSNNRL